MHVAATKTGGKHGTLPEYVAACFGHDLWRLLLLLFLFFLFLIVTGFTENIVHFEQLQYQREFHESPHSHGSFNDIKY